MSESKYPNESPDYRKARDELLEEEKSMAKSSIFGELSYREIM